MDPVKMTQISIERQARILASSAANIHNIWRGEAPSVVADVVVQGIGRTVRVLVELEYPDGQVREVLDDARTGPEALPSSDGGAGLEGPVP